MMLSLHQPVLDANCVSRLSFLPPFLLCYPKYAVWESQKAAPVLQVIILLLLLLLSEGQKQRCAGKGCAHPKQDEMQVGTASNGRLYPCVSVLTTEPGESMRSG